MRRAGAACETAQLQPDELARILRTTEEGAFPGTASVVLSGHRRRRVSLSAVIETSRLRWQTVFQLYSDDWSELLPLEVGDDGRFSDERLALYPPPGCRAARILGLRCERFAGSEIVTERRRLTGDAGVCGMAGFFVMRRYRRRGVGHAAAVAVFQRFGGADGRSVNHDGKVNATVCRRKLIDGYTAGNYLELRSNDANWVGPVQTFGPLRPTE